jgi:NADH-quinone oxidoreductase subunit L
MLNGAVSSELIRWIPLLPLAGAAIQATTLFVLRRPVRRTWVVAMSVVPLILSFLFTCAAFAELIELTDGTRMQIDSLWSWVGLGVGDEAFSADFAFRFDALSGTTALLIIVVSLLVWLFALGFMEGDTRPDAGYQRFFMYMSFVLSSLLVFVLGENLLVILAGWIGTGLGTAALMGFWYSDPRGGRATIRSISFSFVVDALLIASFVGLFWSLAATGAHTSSLSDIEASISALGELIVTLPLGFEVRTLTLLGMGIGLAACGRSAQLPFSFALSGISRSPVPAAALGVLSASMGVYLCCRFSFLLSATEPASSMIAWAGGLTAVMAAVSALAQRDLVSMLIAVTISQFGIAFLAIGCGAYSAAIFQFAMVAIVSTLLIFSAGAVIHCLEGERDIRRMGGLNSRLVLTHLMVVVGVLSPAAFLSREQAIATVFAAQYVPGSLALYSLSLVAALLVSWSLSRYLIGVFWGSIRTPLGFRDEFSDPRLGLMLPMYGLALLSVLGVALNPAQIWGDLLPGGVEGSDSLGRFLSGVLPAGAGDAIEAGLRWQLVAGVLLAMVLGFGITYLLYIRFPSTRIKLNERLAPVQRMLAGNDLGGLLGRQVAVPLNALSRAVFVGQSIVRDNGPRTLLLDVLRALLYRLPSRSRATNLGLTQVSLLMVLFGVLMMLAWVTQ